MRLRVSKQRLSHDTRPATDSAGARRTVGDLEHVVGCVVAVVAEIGGDHRRVGADLFGRSRGDEVAEVEHHHLVADTHHEVHVVLDDQDRHAPVFGQAADHPGQLGALGRAETGGRLIEQEHAGAHRHRPGDRQQSSLSVRQVPDIAMQILVELELQDGPHHLGRKRRIDRPHQIERVRAEILRVCRHAEVLEHGRVLEQLERLERPGHTRPGALHCRRLRQIDVVEQHPALGSGESTDGIDQRRLAGAVRPDQAGDDSRFESVAHVVDGGHDAVAHRQPLQRERPRCYSGVVVGGGSWGQRHRRAR